MPAAPRPGNPADCRRVWTWAVLLSALTCIMFVGVARNSPDPTVGMREAKWASSDSSTSSASHLGSAVSSGGITGTGTGGGPSERNNGDADIGPMLHLASVPTTKKTSSTLSQSVQQDGDTTTTHQHGMQVTPLRSRGTMCIRHEHYLPEYVEAPLPEVGSEKSGGGNWAKFAKQLSQDAAVSTARLVLLGDSITEAWRGTSKGERKSEYKRGPAVLQRELGEYNPLPLAIAGDETTHLLWRLENGGFPSGDGSGSGSGSAASVSKSPEIVAVMIGTNDIGSVVRNVNGGWSDGACVSDENVEEAMSAAPATVAGIKAIVTKIRQLAPDADVVVLGLLPRGERHGKGWTRKYSYLQPSVYTPAIDEVNRRVEEYVESLSGGGGGGGGESSSLSSPSSSSPSVIYTPCTEPWLQPDGSDGHVRVDKSLMKDALHPTEKGMAVLAGCIKDGIAKALERRHATGAGGGAGAGEEGSAVAVGAAAGAAEEAADAGGDVNGDRGGGRRR